MHKDDPTGEPAAMMDDVAAELADLGMTEAELDAALADHGPEPGLTALWEPDEQMVARVTSRVESRLTDREALRATIDLCGLGWFTLKAILSDNRESHEY